MSVSFYRERARTVLKGKWGLAVLAGFLASLFGACLMSSGGSSVDIDQETLSQAPEFLQTYFSIALSVGGVLGILQFIMGGVVRLGYCRFLLNMEDGEKADVKDLFSQFHRFGDGFLLYLLEAVFITLWSMLFIIPGIVAAYRYSMASFIMLENPGMGARDAIRASKEMMHGLKGELFLLDLSFIGWILLSILTLGIGSLWLVPYQNASYAAFYRSYIRRAAPTPNPDLFPNVNEVV